MNLTTEQLANMIVVVATTEIVDLEDTKEMTAWLTYFNDGVPAAVGGRFGSKYVEPLFAVMAGLRSAMTREEWAALSAVTWTCFATYLEG